jgi:hypothetical protein
VPGALSDALAHAHAALRLDQAVIEISQDIKKLDQCFAKIEAALETD